MEYTLTELISEWKVRKGFIPLRTDATFIRQDAFEIDEYARREIDGWYERLLDTAPTELLETTDVTAEVSIENFADGVLTVRLPQGCRRLVEIKANEWKRPATIVTNHNDALCHRQESVFSRGGRECPVAVCYHGGRVMLYSFASTPDTPNLERVIAVMKPANGIYRCAPRALELLWNQDLWKQIKKY